MLARYPLGKELRRYKLRRCLEVSTYTYSLYRDTIARPDNGIVVERDERVGGATRLGLDFM